MSAYNKVTKTGPRSVITSTGEQMTNLSGAVGYGREAKGELFLLAVTNMGSDTFYESAKLRDSRFAKLCGEVATVDVDWFIEFVNWLRRDANMRTAALVAAGHGVHDRIQRGAFGRNRQLINMSMDRADEPGEMLAFWNATYGRKIPQPVKRGIADATSRLYNQFSALKYDTASHAFRFGDVLALTHPRTGLTTRGNLHSWLVGRRYGREDADPSLLMVSANRQLRQDALTDPAQLLQTWRLRQAGMTWEDALSLAGSRVEKKALWETLIPTMGYMALLRNLRNFDEAGVSDKVANQVIAKLVDREEVARSRQFPMRFLSAYRNAPSLRWAYPLERALESSLSNIPSLPGHTLIMVDTSGSMNDPLSAKSQLRRWDAAALFGLALGARCEKSTIVSFSGAKQTKVFTALQGESVLKKLDRWAAGYRFNSGTSTGWAIKQHFAGHDRVVVLTDEQDNAVSWSYGSSGYVPVNESLPATTPLFTWNLAGYGMGHAPSGSRYRHVMGGFSDQGFKVIPLVSEMSAGSRWPWEVMDATPLTDIG